MSDLTRKCDVDHKGDLSLANLGPVRKMADWVNSTNSSNPSRPILVLKKISIQP